MAQVLSWVSLGLGGAAVLHALYRASRAKAAFPPGLALPLGVAAGLALLAALLTLPTGEPWSPGQTLAPGLLLGAGAVILAALAARGTDAVHEAFLRNSAAVGAAVVAVGLLLLLYPARILDSLAGCAAGAVTAGVLVSGCARLASRSAEGDRVAAAAELAALSVVTLATATYLATYHRSPTGIREWQPLPALLAATLAAGLAVRALLPGDGMRPQITLPVVLGPLLLMTALAAFKLGGTGDFLITVAVGLGVYGLVYWLGALDGDARENGRLPLRADVGLLASLLVLGGAVVAFRGLHGFGLSLAALAGLAVAAVALPGRGASLVRGAVALGLLLALYRVFAESSEYRRSLEPDFLYYYVALLAAALLPALLGGAAVRWMESRTATSAPMTGREPDTAPGELMPSALSRLLLVGLAAALAPLAVWLLVGERPLAGFLVGLAVGAGFLLARWGAGRNPESAPSVEREAGAERSLAGLLALGMALAAVQLTPLLAPLAMRTRWERIGILAGLAVLAVAWIAGTAWWEGRRRGAPRVAVPGGSVPGD